MRPRRIRFAFLAVLLASACSTQSPRVWCPVDVPTEQIIVLDGLPFAIREGRCGLALISLEPVRILDGQYLRAVLFYESEASQPYYFDPQAQWLMEVTSPDTTFPGFPPVPSEVISTTYEISGYGDLTQAAFQTHPTPNLLGPDSPYRTPMVSSSAMQRILCDYELPGLLRARELGPLEILAGTSYFEVPKRWGPGQRLHRNVPQYRQIDASACLVTLHLVTPCDTISVALRMQDADGPHPE